MRATVFLSHANPEDNRFTRWLALQLAREGYRVWSDVTGLIGGEDFWQEAERTIREQTLKFVCVVSRVSNVKAGPLKELHIAETVARRNPEFGDFIIPVLIDDLPHADINIQLARLNAIHFKPSWALGLRILLEKLEHDGVPRTSESSPIAVASWWRAHVSADDGILQVEEDYLSNWFPFAGLPTGVHFHELRGDPPPETAFPYPAVWQRPYLVSFAPVGSLNEHLGKDALRTTRIFSSSVFLAEGGAGIPARQARDVIYRLLRMGWERFVTRRGLPTYELANHALCAYFTADAAGTDRVSFRSVDGKTGHRQLMGYRTRTKAGAAADEVRKRFWHFAVQARPLLYPRFAYVIRAHVLFSYDGTQIWPSKDRLHRARRSACRDWWNDDWRDRMLAAISWLALGAETIKIELGPQVFVEVATEPARFLSPVSYLEPENSGEPVESEGGSREDDTEDDDEDIDE
jgi:TIR domain